MKILILFCAIFFVVVQAQTQDAVIAETGSQIISSLRQVKKSTIGLRSVYEEYMTTGLRLIQSDYDAFVNMETNMINNNVLPMLNGMYNTSVLKSLYTIYNLLPAIRQQNLDLRNIAYNDKTLTWQQISARFDFWINRDSNSFQHAIMKHILNKFADNSIVVASVASCRQTAFAAFNATFQSSYDTINKCQDRSNYYAASQLYVNAWWPMYRTSQSLFTTALAYCMTTNTIENAWAMDWVTDDQRNGFIGCMDQTYNINNYIKIYKSDYLKPFVDKMTLESTAVKACFMNAGDYTINTTLVNAEAAYVVCLSTAIQSG